MELYIYQEEAMKTAVYGAESRIIYPALGLAGEAGETAGKIAKVFRDSNGVFGEEQKQVIMDEMGDVLWMLAALANDLGTSLNLIAEENLAKLRDRQERNVIQGSGDKR